MWLEAWQWRVKSCLFDLSCFAEVRQNVLLRQENDEMRKIALAVPCPELGCTAPVALQRLQCTSCVGCVGTCRLCAIEKKAARHIRVAVSTIYQAKHVDHIHKLLVSLSFYFNVWSLWILFVLDMFCRRSYAALPFAPVALVRFVAKRKATRWKGADIRYCYIEKIVRRTSHFPLILCRKSLEVKDTWLQAPPKQARVKRSEQAMEWTVLSALQPSGHISWTLQKYRSEAELANNASIVDCRPSYMDYWRLL